MLHELLSPDDPLLHGKTPTVPLVHTTDELFAAHGECSARRTFFWVRTTLQDKTVWGLADTGACRNLINFDFYQNLPIKGTMFPPGSVQVIAGDGNALDLLGWVILKLEIGNDVVYHEVGVVKDLPVAVLLGGELMRPHCCSLQYTATGRNNFHLRTPSCSVC